MKTMSTQIARTTEPSKPLKWRISPRAQVVAVVISLAYALLIFIPLVYKNVNFVNITEMPLQFTEIGPSVIYFLVTGIVLGTIGNWVYRREQLPETRKVTNFFLNFMPAVLIAIGGQLLFNPAVPCMLERCLAPFTLETTVGILIFGVAISFNTRLVVGWREWLNIMLGFADVTSDEWKGCFVRLLMIILVAAALVGLPLLLGILFGHQGSC